MSDAFHFQKLSEIFKKYKASTSLYVGRSGQH